MHMTTKDILPIAYGIRTIGQHVHFKLRFTKPVMDLMRQDAELRPHMRDLNILYNKANTHAHLVCCMHVNTRFVEVLTRCKQRADAQLKIADGQATIQGLGA